MFAFQKERRRRKGQTTTTGRGVFVSAMGHGCVQRILIKPPNPSSYTGKPGDYKRLPCPNSKEEDSKAQRAKWFQTALDKLAALTIQRQWKTIAFPENIGCGLAGGDWTVYRSMIVQFAQKVYPATVVFIVSLKK
jgi:hypothetical protein